MKKQEKNKLIDKLLIFMKNEIERQGQPITNIHFDFEIEENGYYHSGEPFHKPDGMDLQEFKKDINITNEKFTLVFKCCVTHSYISGRQGYCRLTDNGMTRANSVENAPTPKDKVISFLCSGLGLIVTNIITVVVTIIVTNLIKGGSCG